MAEGTHAMVQQDLAESGVEATRIFMMQEEELIIESGGWYNNEDFFRGMQLLDEHLWNLYDTEVCAREECLEKARFPADFEAKADAKARGAAGPGDHEHPARGDELDVVDQELTGALDVEVDATARRDPARRHGLPLAVTMAGGYAPRIEDTVDIHFATVKAAAS